MHSTNHPGRTLLLALVAVLAMLPGVAMAQTSGTPSTLTDEPPLSIWQTLDGVEEAIVRTWADVAPPGTPAAEETTSRFLTGLVVDFDDAASAGAGLEGLRDWMMASLQVNLVDVEVTEEVGEVTNFGDNATVVRATGTSGDSPLEIVVFVGQVENRLLAVGGSVLSDMDLLPVIQNVAGVMLEREPSDEPVAQGEQGRFTGGNWAIFPEEGDAALDGMQHQADLPIYQPSTPTE